MNFVIQRNEEELKKLIKEHYGEGCESHYNKTPLAQQNGAYFIAIENPQYGSWDECFVNYISYFFYYPANKKAIFWNSGQEPTFWHSEWSSESNYFYDNKMVDSFRFIEPENSENAQIQEDPFTDWKTYQNEEYGFEIKYPNDIGVVATQEQDRFLLSLQGLPLSIFVSTPEEYSPRAEGVYSIMYDRTKRVWSQEIPEYRGPPKREYICSDSGSFKVNTPIGAEVGTTFPGGGHGTVWEDYVIATINNLLYVLRLEIVNDGIRDQTLFSAPKLELSEKIIDSFRLIEAESVTTQCAE